MKFIPSEVARMVTRSTLISQKNSPSFLFAAGISGMVGSTVLACRATLKVEKVLAKAENDLSIVKSMDSPDYSEHDRQKDRAIVLTRTSMELFQLYAPAIAVGALSVVALTKSHKILADRNAALAAAYTAVDKAFTRYRERVVEKYGEDEDRQFRYGSVTHQDPEDGRRHIHRVDPDMETPSMYARFFDQYSTNWSKEPSYNLTFLSCVQQNLNNNLIARGHVFLNEVYDALGLSRTQAGSVVGWIISEEGDNFIDFGIWDGSQQARDFVNGREGSILLDFNVDGLIYDKIGTQKERTRWQS